jgi:hypothetical protein
MNCYRTLLTRISETILNFLRGATDGREEVSDKSTSDLKHFAAVFETMTPPVFVIPLNYRWLSTLTTPKNLETLHHSDDLMLHLPADIRMFLSQIQAEELKKACQRVYSREDYQSHRGSYPG